MLTECQERALDRLLRQGNVFLTGAAGTGKSFLLSKYLRGKGRSEFPVVASTGAAAVLVGGRTFHSFFGIGIMEGGLHATISRAVRNKRLVSRLMQAQCVVIDEISMLSGETLMAAEAVARKARGTEEPWGGLRIVAVGDFAQLPPVTHGDQRKDWAFLHPVWNWSRFEPALLSTVMRTQDTEFLDVLNDIRDGKVTERVREYLDRHTEEDSMQAEGTRLYPHRAQADQFNLYKLEELPSREYNFHTRYEGSEKYMESAAKSLPIPGVLRLKEGALIMMRKNDVSFPPKYVNGSLGYVRAVSEEKLTVSLFTGDFIEVSQEKFSSLDGDGREVMAAWNFPVSLAWATTIHKAQGASLDRLIVNLDALWEPGQAYVALSRVRSGNGLTIERWNSRSIHAEPLVTQFYNRLAVESESYVPKPLYEPEVREAREESYEASPRREKRSPRSAKAKSAMICELLQKKLTLQNIAEQCDMREERVVTYVEKLVLEGRQLDLEYLLSDVDSADRAVRAFEELGIERLRPVFESLGEEVSYDTLKIIRCVVAARGE